MEALINQLKQRQVFKVATIYAVSAWPLIQVADLAVPALGLPDSVMTLLLKIFLIGFPVTLVFAWLFNFTSQGIVRAHDSADSNIDIQPDSMQVNMQTTVVVVGTLIVALLVTLGSQLLMKSSMDNAEHFTTATHQSITVNNQLALNTASIGTETNSLENLKKASIAVLPFIPFSQDPSDEFFADGMVEELLNLLAKIPDLQVAARTSSFAYKNVSNKTIVQIGQELGVDTILEGSIRKNDITNQIRVTTQLIKVETGEHLWSETFDREYRDVFQIQDDIARAVVDKMKVTLLGEHEANAFIAETKNVDAMVAFGKGQQELSHRTVPSLQKALEHFSEAVHADQDYARAYVGIADANILLALYGNLPTKVARENATIALEKALMLNDKLAAAYASLGLLWSPQDAKLAEQHFQRAIELNPNYAMTFMWYGSLLEERGDFVKSHQLFERAFELNPKSPVAAFNVASGYYQLGDEEKAMELFSHIIKNDPYYPSAYNLVGNILSNSGRLDEAITMYKRALDVDSINKQALSGLLNATMDMGDFETTNTWFDYLAQQVEIFSPAEIQMYKARFYGAQGKLEQALAHLAGVNYSSEESKKNLLVQAEVAFYRQQYSQAINLFEQSRSDDPQDNSFYQMSNGLSIIHLAYAYQQIEQHDKADALMNDNLAYLQRTEKRNTNNPNYYFNMAAMKALQNNKEEFYYYLQAAIDTGWVRTWQAETEPFLHEFLSDQQYVQMLGGVKARLVNMKRRLNNEDSFLLADSENFEAFH